MDVAVAQHTVLRTPQIQVDREHSSTGTKRFACAYADAWQHFTPQVDGDHTGRILRLDHMH
jgi:hypothetical protein